MISLISRLSLVSFVQIKLKKDVAEILTMLFTLRTKVKGHFHFLCASCVFYNEHELFVTGILNIDF